MRCQTLKFITLWLAICLSARLPASAQSVAQSIAQSVDSDRTTGTVVSGSNPFTITEGTIRPGDTSATVFHSFGTFSPAASAVVFDLRDSQNAVDTQTVAAIVGRVTGGASSFIDGQISILQDSNTPAPDLFLINPYGVLFGENVQLSLPGSFLASTAESILFEGEAAFSAVNPSAAPLLTVSTPVGLQFGTTSRGHGQFGTSSSAGITLRGTGHAIATDSPLFSPYFPVGTDSGLSVATGERLSLIGGAIDTSGGVLSAPGGRVELGSVDVGIVALTDQGADYSAVRQFGDIGLAERSLINVSGPTAGSVQLQGREIRLSDGSLIWSQNQGVDTAGEIAVRATEQLSLTGATPAVDATSSIITETLAPGNAGEIDISASQLSVDAGAALGSRSFSAGNSGRLQISAERMNVSGYVPNAPDVFSSVGTLGFSSGNLSNTEVTSQSLSITEGGYLGTATLGSGRGGDVTVSADSIQVIGTTPSAIPSIISATTAGRLGNSGNISVNTRELIVSNSGLVTTASVGVGNAGDISVEASERVVLSGSSPNLPTSSIASTVDFPPLSYKLLLGLSNAPRGSAGNVTISTPTIEISDRASIAVSNFGEGDAGWLMVNADSILVKRGAIDAFTTAGEGGNIDLNIRNVLLMRDQSTVNVIARGRGNGGNIIINSPVIIGLENSDIVASAFTGSGGNISITTQGLFGLVARDQRSPENDITASSQFGLSGTVSINDWPLQPNTNTVELSDTVSDPDTQVARRCADAGGNQFIASGRGGLPMSPTDHLLVTRTWHDFRPIAAPQSDTDLLPEDAIQTSLIRGPSLEPSQEPFLEANSWYPNEEGEIVLGSTEASSVHTAVTNCPT